MSSNGVIGRVNVMIEVKSGYVTRRLSGSIIVNDGIITRSYDPCRYYIIKHGDMLAMFDGIMETREGEIEQILFINIGLPPPSQNIQNGGDVNW